METMTLTQLSLENIVHYLEQDRMTGFLTKCLQSHHTTTYWHSLRVAYMSVMIAKTYSFSFDEIDILFRSAFLHDIGKLAISVEALDKEGKLTPEEWALIQTHPQKGVQLIKELVNKDSFDFEVILYHHENLDGTGYPYGKNENELPLSVRIVRVVDSFDAMTSVRSYNRKINATEAVKELYEKSGACFDFEVVRRLHHCLTEKSQEIDAISLIFNSLNGRN